MLTLSLPLPVRDAAVDHLRDCLADASHLVSLIDAPSMEAAANLDFMALIGLATMSPRCKDLAGECLHRRWCSFLRAIAPELPAQVFIDALKSTRSVFSGSACIAFLFPPSTWKMGDVDVFCPQDNYDNFCDFLLHALPGTLILDQTKDDLAALSHDYHGRRVIGRRKIRTDNTTFDVLCADSLCALTAVASFFATHVMNVVTADSICIAYPLLLSQQRGLLRPFFNREVHGPLISKWQHRNFNLQEDRTLWQTSTSCNDPLLLCPRQLRYFGDPYCITFRFTNEYISHVQRTELSANNELLQHSLHMTACWVLGGLPCGNPRCDLACPACAEGFLLAKDIELL
ncbi:hypothetical protein NM688_g7094 [Phlebia brevispora]|uniref:Uncharacterized protein n=1 Tax=Phlebia brevispora TaxID=194682 RepID=A0ACC1S9D2_9APHY|nr:hypothetical protein NM688_g7094 [Phlebia brevispora]